MASHGHAGGWALVGSYALFVLGLPLLIGLVSRTARRATLFSALCGLLGAIVVVGGAMYLRGVRGLPSIQVALFFFATGAAVASLVGWLTQRMAELFRQETPLTAAWKALRLLSLAMVRAALLFVVLNGLWIIATIDFADEIPELMSMRLELTDYLCIGAATAIGLVWIFTSTRPDKTSNVMGRAVVQVLPGVVAVLLFLPILMAHLQVAWSTPLLDCSPRGIPGYVPDMIDFTRLVLDSLAAGALFGFKSALGWQVATCAALATSRLASWLVYGLNLAPITLLALLAYRSRRLLDARRAAS
jgi:hypothetical protein